MPNYSFQGTKTIGVESVLALSFKSYNNNAYCISIDANGYDIKGNPGQTVLLNSLFRFKNVEGIVTVGNDLYGIKDADSNLMGVSVSVLPSMNGMVDVYLNGASAETIIWSGNINIYN